MGARVATVAHFASNETWNQGAHDLFTTYLETVIVRATIAGMADDDWYKPNPTTAPPRQPKPVAPSKKRSAGWKG